MKLYSCRFFWCVLAFAVVLPAFAKITIPTGEVSGEYLILPTVYKEDASRKNLKENLAQKGKKAEDLEDLELLNVPDKYLTPELQARKRIAKEKAKTQAVAVNRIRPKATTVDVKEKNQTRKVNIQDAVVKADATLTPKRLLPDVELIQEIKIEASKEVKKEVLPGERREVYEIFKYGKTSDPNQMPLLPAFKAYERGDYATSATLAYDVFSKTNSESTSELAAYLMAHSLYQAGFYSTALGPLVELSETKWRRSALGMIAECMKHTEDRSAVRSVLEKISISQIPERYKSLFAYHLGRILLNAGHAQAATSAFAQVEPSSPEYGEAQYFTGVILSEGIPTGVAAKNAWTKEGTQVFDARASLETAAQIARAQSNNNLRDLANLSLGRLAYQAELYNQAVFYYNEVPVTSPFARAAFFESAWALYRGGEFTRSQGYLHPLGSAYYEHRDFADLRTLRSLNYLKLCRFDEATKSVNTFQTEFGKTLKDLENTLAVLKDKSFDKISDIDNTKVPAWVRRIVLEDPLVLLDKDREQRLIQERSRLSGISKNPVIADKNMKASAEGFFEKILDRRLNFLLKTTRPYVVSRIEEIHRDYKAEAPKIDILRYEIYSQATKYPEAVKRLQAKRMVKEGEYLPGVFLKGKEILWRFNGEHWQDELKGYDYFIPTECGDNNKT